MSGAPLTGWQRLGVTVTLLWIAVVVLAGATETVMPHLHRWLLPEIIWDDTPVFFQLRWARLIGLLALPILLLWLLGWACAWVRVGFDQAFDTRYLKADRLPDVLALIQVLALDQDAHRSEKGLQTELQGTPKSCDTWTSLAGEHPEFFRVHPEAAHGVSLVARHVVPKNEQGARILPADYTSRFLQLAVELHDRQLRRAQTWHVLVPVLVALIAGAMTLISTSLQGQ